MAQSTTFAWRVFMIASSVVFVSWSRAMHAQDSTRGDFLDCEDSPRAPGATIRGRLLDADGRPVSQRGVFVARTVCSAVTDSLGYFILGGLPPGDYEVHVGTLGYRHEKPRLVRLPADSGALLIFRLRPENEVADCEETPACAEWLGPPRDGIARSPAEALRAGALRLVVGILAERWRADSAVLCMSDSSVRVLSAVREPGTTVVPESQCALDR